MNRRFVEIFVFNLLFSFTGIQAARVKIVLFDDHQQEVVACKNVGLFRSVGRNKDVDFTPRFSACEAFDIPIGLYEVKVSGALLGVATGMCPVADGSDTLCLVKWDMSGSVLYAPNPISIDLDWAPASREDFSDRAAFVCCIFSDWHLLIPVPKTNRIKFSSRCRDLSVTFIVRDRIVGSTVLNARKESSHRIVVDESKGLVMGKSAGLNGPSQKRRE